jgi:hypothetical protein
VDIDGEIETEGETDGLIDGEAETDGETDGLTDEICP